MMSLFIPRLKSLIEQSGKKQNAICIELSISKQKLSKWKTGYNEPSLDEIAMIARYFDVSTDYLIGIENEDGTKLNILNSFNNFNNTNGNFNFGNHNTNKGANK